MKSFRIINSIIVPPFILLICVMMLALTCTLTRPRIDARAAADANLSRMEVLPEADAFTPSDRKNFLEGVREVYYAKNGAGSVITVEYEGHTDRIVVMTGIDSKGSVRLVKVIDTGDKTPSKRGAVSYSKLYLEASYTYFGAEARAKSLVDQLSRTTYSISEVLSAVSLALAQFDELGGGF